MDAGGAVPRPRREEVALREVGQTQVGTWTARALVVALLATLAVPAALERLAGREAAGFLTALADGARRAREVLAEEGARAANRELLAAMSLAEERLEERSVLRESLLPPVQRALSRLGLGNEQAYLGREGWLFYRPDVEYVTGPGFLDPRVLERRRRSGDAWQSPPEPDPLPALLAFHRDLERRGVQLLLAPTPLKPMVHPERFSRRAGAAAALQNPSYEAFLDRLERAEIPVVDLAGLLADRTAAGEPQFLRADTHWTPAAMEAAAEAIASTVSELAGPPPPTAPRLLHRPATLQGVGDIAAMLDLPAGAPGMEPETIAARRVLNVTGAPWRPDPRAEVLLLGDSFTNVFSDPELGWGAGAGLAEQLAYRLGRPVDRIALNAGGAVASREALARALAEEPARLSAKRVVVYQFACRELAFGDWRVVSLP